jgi:hypothetical protein
VCLFTFTFLSFNCIGFYFTFSVFHIFKQANSSLADNFMKKLKTFLFSYFESNLKLLLVKSHRHSV